MSDSPMQSADELARREATTAAYWKLIAKRDENLAQCVTDEERFAERTAIDLEGQANGLEGLYVGWLAKGITQYSAQPIYEIALKVGLLRSIADGLRRSRWIRQESDSYRSQEKSA